MSNPDKKKQQLSQEARSVLVSGRSGKIEAKKEKSIIEYKPIKFMKTRETKPTKPEKKTKPKYHPIILKGKIKKIDKRAELRDKRIKKSLHYSTAEGVFNGASSSITESYITPFALSLHASNFHIGLLFSMRNMMNTIAQIPGARLTNIFERKRIWVFSQVISKIALWIPILFLPLLHFDVAIILLITIFAAMGFFSALRSPAWSSLMGDLVPMKKRGRFFGTRNMATGIAGVVATLAAGFLLSSFGFPLIFVIAIILAAISIPLFLKMYEPPFRKVYHYTHSFALNPRDWPKSLRANRSLAIFTIYLFFMYFAVEIASPFYAVYMLRDLGISYAWFGVLTVVGAVARILSFRYWGKLNDRFGSRKILVVCGVFGCFTPLGWIFVFDVFSIAALRIFDGFIWSGFDMVVFNYLLDVTPAEKRPQYVANHNFVAGMGVVMGAATGGFLAESWSGTSFMWLHGLQVVFLLSFLLRLACLSLLPKINEVVIKQSDVPIKYVFWQAIAVEPTRSVMHTISYTFRYPYVIEDKFKRIIRGRRYG